MDWIGPKNLDSLWIRFLSLDWIGPDLDSIVPVWIVLELNSIFRLSLCWCDARF